LFIAMLMFALVIVFAAAELFTNALEIVGERIGVSEGVTGSIFAAVGTAMPETIVPVVAVLAGGSSLELNQSVGMGAILGAPFMLATLSLGMMAWFAGHKRGWSRPLRPEATGLGRDLKVFFIGYGLAVLVGILPPAWHEVRVMAAISLCIVYFLYLLRTIRASHDLVLNGHVTEADHHLYIARFLGSGNLMVISQLITGLVLLVWGAKLFVQGIEGISDMLGISALVMSLLIVPIATELPEKINSILWIRRDRDTLAFGNLTGAMVFQGTLLPALGMTLMPWHLKITSPAAVSIMLALAGVAWLSWLHSSGRLQARYLLTNASLYGLFIVYVILSA